MQAIVGDRLCNFPHCRALAPSIGARLQLFDD